MGRINNLFRWGFLIAVTAAGFARLAPDRRGAMVEMLAACLVVFGFVAWCLIAYIHAWTLAIREGLALWRERRAHEVYSKGAAMLAAPEIVPGRCYCQRECRRGRGARCPLGVCRGY
jgi:hypothetical protein